MITARTKSLANHLKLAQSERQPNPEIVQRIEGLLERAKAGDIVTFAYAMDNGNNDTSWGSVCQTIQQSMSLMAALNLAHHQILIGVHSGAEETGK